MSRASSSVITFKCDVIACDKEYVSVKIGETLTFEAGWGQVQVEDEEKDLCPEHYQEFLGFLYGPDDDHAPTYDPNDEVPMTAKDYG